MKHSSRYLPATVYKVTNLINGKFYIGVTTNGLRHRLNQHFAVANQTKKTINGAFQKAIRKYGRHAFVIEKIVDCETAAIALEEEVRLIAELKPHYNSTKGGDGTAGHTLSPEAKAKIGATNRGNKYALGKTHGPETRELLRQHGIARKALFAEFSHLGPAASSRPVVRLNDGREFASASAAAKECGIAKSLVIELCLRDPRRATARGMVFRYIGDVLDAKTELETAMKRTSKKYRQEV